MLKRFDDRFVQKKMPQNNADRHFEGAKMMPLLSNAEGRFDCKTPHQSADQEVTPRTLCVFLWYLVH